MSLKVILFLFPLLPLCAENNVFSPYSLKKTLHMLYLGAEGETKRELEPFILEEIVDLPEIKEATALFHKKTIELLPSFLTSLSPSFFTSNIDPETLEEPINAWIFKQTGIPLFFPKKKITNQTALVALSTLYLSTPWQTPFKKNLTENKPFFGKDKTVQAATMQIDKELLYLETEEGDFLAIPLKSSKEPLYFVLFLDRGNQSFSAPIFEISEMGKRWIHLEMPIFSCTSSWDLKETLKEKGVKSAFSSSANFSSLSKSPLALDDVLQKVKIEVSEGGVKAAAVTAATMRLTSGYNKKEKILTPFIANRPFFYYIMTEKIVLFEGKIDLPEGVNSSEEIF